MAFFVVLALLIFSSPIKNGCLRGSPGRRKFINIFLNVRQCGKGIRLGRNGRYKCMGVQIKSLTRRLRRSARAKEGRKMINCDYSYVVTILLILLAVAAGLLVYALCVASKNADELADSMYSRMIQHNISMDNHSHWGE